MDAREKRKLFPIKSRGSRQQKHIGTMIISWSYTVKPTIKIGDLVAQSYGEGQRPVAIVVGWYEYGTPGDLALVLWVGEKFPVAVATKYLDVISESR